jgi:predicted acetyltransferase
MLIKPSIEYESELLALRQEFRDIGEKMHGDSYLNRSETVADWIERNRLMESQDTMPDNRLAASTEYILIRKSDNKVIGLINLRHSLVNEDLQKFAGHIGYCVRPSERRRGYATAMLKLCLERANGLRIDRVLITCLSDNESSRKTILACGGVYESTVDYPRGGQIERYWVSTKR